MNDGDETSHTNRGNNDTTNDHGNISEHDECVDNLHISFDDSTVEEEGAMENYWEGPPAVRFTDNLTLLPACEAEQQTPQQCDDDSTDDCGKKVPSSLDNVEEYILGTLIIRVVAARDLEPVNSSISPALFFFGDRVDGMRSSGGQRHHGTSNPYASVRFGRTVQRTSPCFNTTDPVWPRGESMYMDVTQILTEPLSDPTQDVNSSLRSTTRAKDRLDKACGDSSPLIKKPSFSTEATNTSSGTVSQPRTIMKPILTVSVFHTNGSGMVKKIPHGNGDSDDRFLGMTAIDLTQLLTGKIATYDEWLPLQGSKSRNARVRVVVEYEPSDSRLQKGDWVQFTNFCHAADLYPLHLDQLYKVVETDGDDVMISHTTPEGWVTTFMAHRYMLICQKRHHGVVEFCQEEFASLSRRIAHSPMIQVVQDTVQKIPDEGLVTIGNTAVQGMVNTFARWMQGGLPTALQDIKYATNWDGRFNPDATSALSDNVDDDENTTQPSAKTDKEDSSEPEYIPEPLPNMPACPITGTLYLTRMIAFLLSKYRCCFSWSYSPPLSPNPYSPT